MRFTIVRGFVRTHTVVLLQEHVNSIPYHPDPALRLKNEVFPYWNDQHARGLPLRWIRLLECETASGIGINRLLHQSRV